MSVILGAYGYYGHNFLNAVEKHPYEAKLSAKEWHRIKQFIGVRDEEADCCGFVDKAEIEAVRSYIYDHGQYGLKTVCTKYSVLTAYIQRLGSIE